MSGPGVREAPGFCKGQALMGPCYITLIPSNLKMSFACTNYGNYTSCYEDIDIYDIKTNDFLRK